MVGMWVRMWVVLGWMCRPAPVARTVRVTCSMSWRVVGLGGLPSFVCSCFACVVWVWCLIGVFECLWCGGVF